MLNEKLGWVGSWMWEAYILSSCVWRWVCEEWSNEEYQRKEGKTKREK